MEDVRRINGWLADVDEFLAQITEWDESDDALVERARELIEERADLPSPCVLVAFAMVAEGSDEFALLLQVDGQTFQSQHPMIGFEDADRAARHLRLMLDPVVMNAVGEAPEEAASSLGLRILDANQEIEA